MKVVGERQKERDRTTSVRLSPMAVMQLNAMQDYMGENASRIMMRAVDCLYNKLVDNGTPLPLGKAPKKAKKKSD